MIPAPAARSDGGIALAVALLFGLALVLLAHGALVLARTERWVAAREGARLQAEARARAAVLELGASVDTLPASGGHETRYGRVDVSDPGPELRALASSPPSDPGTRSSIGWMSLLAAPRPASRVLDRDAAVRVGGTWWTSTGDVVPGVPGDPCPPEAATGVPTGVGLLPPGDSVPRLGPLSLPALVDRLPALGSPLLALDPADPGCGEPGSFGDPLRPGACPASWGAGARAGDLGVEGRGQGVLAVTGDLVMAPTSVFRGWVWVGGTLRLEDGARLVGLADVGGDLVASTTAGVATDPCAAAAALAAVPALARPVTVGPRAWPVFRP